MYDWRTVRVENFKPEQRVGREIPERKRPRETP